MKKPRLRLGLGLVKIFVYVCIYMNIYIHTYIYGAFDLTRVAAPSPRASLGRRTVCGRTEQLSAAGFEALRN